MIMLLEMTQFVDNYMDGRNARHAYLLLQVPMPNALLALLTKLFERNETNCYKTQTTLHFVAPLLPLVDIDVDLTRNNAHIWVYFRSPRILASIGPMQLSEARHDILTRSFGWIIEP